MLHFSNLTKPKLTFIQLNNPLHQSVCNVRIAITHELFVSAYLDAIASEQNRKTVSGRNKAHIG